MSLKALTVSDALKLILAVVAPLEPREHQLEGALGLTLSADVVSSIDSPPFDKSSMDGYAVRSVDLDMGKAVLKVIEVITAGQVPSSSVGPGHASQIMTGAPIPTGADLVVKVEETQRIGDQVSIATRSSSTGANIIRRGTSVRSGDCVLRAGQTLNSPRIGALAELGRSSVLVRPRPRVAILATGDELVSIEETPGPGQIRNSNGKMLSSQIKAAGGIAVPLGIARDRRDDLRSKIAIGLKCDMLILSGGVSAGTLDRVPSTLAEAGVQQVFHQVDLKPGKPIWFGTWDSPVGLTHENRRRCSVFGLPGNPVSSLVCCELFVRTAIRRLMGIEPATPQPILGRLTHDYLARADRPTYHPAKLTWTVDGLAITLVPWNGSSDLCGTVEANGMAFLTGEPRQLCIGDPLESFEW